MSRKIVLTGLSVAALVSGLLVISVVAQEGGKSPGPKVPFSGGASGEQVTITGRFSCTFCSLSHPDRSCGKECCIKCILAGDPPSLTDEDGLRYLLLTGEHEVPLMTPVRMDLLGGPVTVKGLLVRGKGLRAIYVDSIEKADMQVTLTGRLTCTFCALSHPDKPCQKECCVRCLKAGDPPALVDAEGNLYSLVSHEHEVTVMTAERLELAGQQVIVKGLLVRSRGLQAVFVDSIEKAGTR